MCGKTTHVDQTAAVVRLKDINPTKWRRSAAAARVSCAVDCAVIGACAEEEEEEEASFLNRYL